LTCGSCSASNADGNVFCVACGQRLAPTCAGCGVQLAPGARFCTTCGTKVSTAARSVVAEGVWVRDPSEVVRRVSRDELRQAFGGAELDGFFAGTLAGRLLDAFTSRSIRVPPGSVGALWRDGAVVRVLPPGEQLTASGLRDVVRDGLEAWSGAARTALYLVDRRPLVAGHTTEVARAGSTVATEVTATFTLPATPTALGAFVDTVVRDADALTATALHSRLRADLEQQVADAVRAHGADLRAAERATARGLQERALAGTGLVVEVAFARKDTTHRVNLALGGEVATAPPCSGCGASVGAGQAFCTTCGAKQPATGASEGLVTRDGTAVELDVALVLVGDVAPPSLRTALAAGARAWLRDHDLAAATVATGFSGLAEALQRAITEPLRASGHHVAALDVVDLRSVSGAWTLNARASMDAARAAATVGREWLAVREGERSLEAATFAAVRAQQSLARDHAFAEREAVVADRARQAGLDEAERALRMTERAGAHREGSTGADLDHARRMQALGHDAEAERLRLAQASERRRREAEDAAHEDRLRREARLAELTAMSALERDVAEREHRHEQEVLARLEGKTEAQMLAMQATRLADATHGAAFAEALGRIADGEAARRERERAEARADAKDERTQKLVESMLGGSRDAEAVARGAYRDVAQTTKEMAQTAVSSHAQVVAATRPCSGCGVPLAAAAKFCGVCGTTTGG
jgi:hypothetical protein